MHFVVKFLNSLQMNIKERKEVHFTQNQKIEQSTNPNPHFIKIVEQNESQYIQPELQQSVDSQILPVKSKMINHFNRNENYCKKNFGLRLNNLKGNIEQWRKLRQVLRECCIEMEQCVVKGSAPLFGYPTVLYEVPSDPKRALTDNVITKNEHRVSVSKLLSAIKTEQDKEQQLLKKFQKGMHLSQELPPCQTSFQLRTKTSQEHHPYESSQIKQNSSTQFQHSVSFLMTDIKQKLLKRRKSMKNVNVQEQIQSSDYSGNQPSQKKKSMRISIHNRSVEALGSVEDAVQFSNQLLQKRKRFDEQNETSSSDLRSRQNESVKCNRQLNKNSYRKLQLKRASEESFDQKSLKNKILNARKQHNENSPKQNQIDFQDYNYHQEVQNHLNYVVQLSEKFQRRNSFSKPQLIKITAGCKKNHIKYGDLSQVFSNRVQQKMLQDIISNCDPYSSDLPIKRIKILSQRRERESLSSRCLLLEEIEQIYRQKQSLIVRAKSAKSIRSKQSNFQSPLL